ncbi:Crp/Fnr family transcriptional regulator [Mannheimia sp. E15BD]|uniref:Crp/Fnr family transcriptional regulator n=1 Tax=unclassified Mannheimia TaxID=2645054 RepID=UPI00359D8519
MDNFPIPEQLLSCQLSVISDLEKGEMIYAQGHQAKEFYFLKSGLIGLYHMLENGKESLVRIYKAQDYFGFRTFFGDHTYHCSARVLQSAEVIRITPSNFTEFWLENTTLITSLLKQLSTELQDAEHRLSMVAYQKTQERVFSSIHYLHHHYPNYRWTNREIAEFAGCETETAIRARRELKKIR